MQAAQRPGRLFPSPPDACRTGRPECATRTAGSRTSRDCTTDAGSTASRSSPSETTSVYVFPAFSSKLGMCRQLGSPAGKATVV